MKTISTSTFNFNNIISNDFLYVDKTDYVQKLVKPAFGEYFLSRPRRFGKSLLVSTLKAVFQGRRDLFEGLAIDKTDYDWKVYPVFHLDFSNSTLHTDEDVVDFLLDALDNFSRDVDIPLRGRSLYTQFENLIADTAKASDVGSVVVLVDEYDKPILGNITNKEHNEAILSVLKGFYSNIKKQEGLIRFAFITGVSKFAHVSLFSDLNNLTDITLNPEYAGMLGFTEADIREFFADRIPLAAEANNCTEEELMGTLLKWYDGYRFSDAETHVCNPVSVSKFFNEGYKFSNYWDSTGMPTFLLKVAREKAYDYEAALTNWFSSSIFSAYELDQLDVTGLLWQTGYLTIKEVRQGRRGLQYRLDFPDMEVMDTFNMRLLEYYGKVEKGEGDTLVDGFEDAITADDLDGFMTLFQSFLANISYDMHLPYEKYYQTIFFVVFKLLGASIEAESRTNEGRIDAYIRTANAVYIFEFKLNKTSRKAVGQIIDRHYYEKVQCCGLPIRMVGVNFNSKKGRIDNWTIHNA